MEFTWPERGAQMLIFFFVIFYLCLDSDGILIIFLCLIVYPPKSTDQSLF